MANTGEPTMRIFPTKHPFVGSSNVLLATFDVGTEDSPKIIVVPTMVDGKKYDPKDAIEIAKGYGFNRYPAFKSEEDANKWIEANHGKIDENGYLTK